MSTVPVPVDPAWADTSLSAAQRHILESSKENVRRLNADLITRYNQAYANYAANMHSGNHIPDEQRQPPKPPMAWELAPPDENGFVWYQIGSTPVCPPGPVITPNSDFVFPHPIAHNISFVWTSRPDGPSIGSFVTAGLDDGMKAGSKSPPMADPTHPDQPPHVYIRLTTAVGPGWWQETD